MTITEHLQRASKAFFWVPSTKNREALVAAIETAKAMGGFGPAVTRAKRVLSGKTRPLAISKKQSEIEQEGFRKLKRLEEEGEDALDEEENDDAEDAADEEEDEPGAGWDPEIPNIDRRHPGLDPFRNGPKKSQRRGGGNDDGAASRLEALARANGDLASALLGERHPREREHAERVLRLGARTEDNFGIDIGTLAAATGIRDPQILNAALAQAKYGRSGPTETMGYRTPFAAPARERMRGDHVLPAPKGAPAMDLTMLGSDLRGHVTDLGDVLGGRADDRPVAIDLTDAIGFTTGRD